MGKFAKILINTIYTSQKNLSEIFFVRTYYKRICILYVFSVIIHILFCLYQKLEISLCLKLIEKYLVVSQCEYLWIFLALTFSVKSKVTNLKFKKLPFSNSRYCYFFNLGNFGNFKRLNFSEIKFMPCEKIVKIVIYRTLDVPNIDFTENSCARKILVFPHC